MEKYSKSKMSRAEEDAYDAALAGLHRRKTQHFQPGTTISSGYRKGLILGRARGILWIEWFDGGSSMVTPMALEHER